MARVRYVSWLASEGGLQAWVVIHAGNGDDVIIREGVAEIVAHAAKLRAAHQSAFRVVTACA
jgi:hypothetical protein